MMAEYVISVNTPGSKKSYFAKAGGYTHSKSLAKFFSSHKDADDTFMVLASANTEVARYGKVEEA